MADPGEDPRGFFDSKGAAAVILVGGLRELTAQTMEDGDPVTDIIEPAVAVATAILGPRAMA